MEIHAFGMGARPFASPAVATYAYSMVKSGPDVDPAEVEVAHLSAIEVMVLWDATVLHVSHLTSPRSFYVGEEVDQLGVDYVIPRETLGATRAPVILSKGASSTLVLLPGARGHVDVPGARRVSVGDLVASGRARPSAEVAGAHEFDLVVGAKARLELAGSPLAIQVSMVTAGKRVGGAFFDSTDPSAFLYSGMSFLLHAGLIAMLAFFMPAMRGDDSEALDRDQILMMQKLLSAAAEREQAEPPPDNSQANAASNEGGSGARSKDEEGAAGKTDAKETGHRYGVAGPKDNPDPHLAAKAALEEAAKWGMLGILSSSMGGDPNAPTAPWGRETSSGTDEKSAMGNMFGADIGDATGMGGLGLTGTGEGGGGRDEGIGMDGFGGLGHGAGGGPGGGIGRGAGLPGRGHPVRAPRVRDSGETSVNGRLPPEVIQRVVRQNFGRFRLCYENGIKTNPNLQGRVAVKFIIDRSGAVATALDGGSDLPDQSVVQCVVRGFGNLSFPQPDNGMVTVVYPIVFSPGE
jgi:hypothetical protein